MTTLALLSTAPSVPAAFDPLVDELLPGVERVHVVDASLLQDARESGVTDALVARMAAHIAGAVDDGADAVLVTCSSIGEVGDQLAARVGVPVVRVDRPMAVEAAATSPRIAVLATLESTLAPTMRLIEGEARARWGDEARVEATVCEGAFDALQQRGDTAAHDAAVGAAIGEAARWAGVIVLAQASMVRAVAAVDVDVPVLSSPRSGVAQLRPILLANR